MTTRTRRLAGIFGLMALASAPSCVRLHGPTDVRRDLGRTAGVQLEQELGNLIGIGVRKALHTVPERGDEVFAEVLDEACRLGQSVTDERKRDPEDLAVQQVLNPF